MAHRQLTGETMKKIRIFSLLMAITLFCTTLTPVAMASDTNTAAFSVEATSAMLLDLDTGAVLFEQNADTRIYPSSLTKIVTAMLILEYGNLNELATVSSTAISEVGDNASTLQVGETLTLDSLLYLIMVSSVNEACNVAAEHISGSIDAFVEMMNEKAASLGCTDTHFANTHGLHNEDHYSTARDLSKLALAAIDTNGFMTYASAEQVTIPATNLSGQRTLITGNYLTSTLTTDEYFYEPAQGIKSGSTTAGGFCLISTAVEAPIRLLSILCGAEAQLNSDGTYTYMSFVETQRMFEYGFSSYEYQVVLNTTDIIATIPALLSAGDQKLELVAVEELTALLPLDYDADELVYDISLSDPDGIEAPVAMGTQLGTVTVSYGDRELGSTTLVSSNAVARSEFAYASQQLRAFLSNIYVKFVIAVLIAVVLLFFLHEFAAAPRRAYRKRLHKWKKQQSRHSAQTEDAAHAKDGADTPTHS